MIWWLELDEWTLMDECNIVVSVLISVCHSLEVDWTKKILSPSVSTNFLYKFSLQISLRWLMPHSMLTMHELFGLVPLHLTVLSYVNQPLVDKNERRKSAACNLLNMCVLFIASTWHVDGLHTWALNAFVLVIRDILKYLLYHCTTKSEVLYTLSVLQQLTNWKLY